MKSVVLDRKGDAIRYHPTILALAAHYHFEPRPVAVARGNEKGRVERSIRIVRESFFAGRKWTDLGDLNRQAEEWVPGTGPRVAVARYRAHASPQEGNSSQAG